MKKTIAKIMAAAMVLSAVPAVALPTLNADAATTVNASTSNVAVDTTNTEVSSDGGTGIVLKTNQKATITDNGKTLKAGSVTVKASAAESGSVATAFIDLVSLAVNDDNEVIVEVDTSSADDKKALIAAVKDGKNGVALTVSDVTEDKVTVTDPIFGNSRFAALTDSTGTVVTVYPGGQIDKKDGKIKSGIAAAEGKLADGDVYAEIDNSTKLEVRIVQGKNDDLDDNDDLRGETLDLTTVTIGSVKYDVVRIGAQALKKAHMKKFYAENAKRIGKGALRGCKQVKKVDIEDGQKVRKINSKAFYGAKSLKNIIIDGRKLNTVGKSAFSGVKKNCVVKIRANKSKYNSDVKMIKKNGGNKNLKFVRK